MSMDLSGDTKDDKKSTNNPSETKGPTADLQQSITRLTDDIKKLEDRLKKYEAERDALDRAAQSEKDDRKRSNLKAEIKDVDANINPIRQQIAAKGLEIAAKENRLAELEKQKDTGEKSGRKRKAPDSGSSSSRKKRKHEHKTPHKSSPEEPAPKHSPPRNQAGKIPDEIKDNPHDFVRLYAIKYSGLEFRGDFAFRRNKAETLGETLQKLRAGETGSTLVVEGPPGTGKSTTVWCHVVQSARKETVVWLHFGAGTVSSTLTVLSPAGIEHSKRNSADLLRQLKKEDDPLLNDATLLVVDGVTREHKTAGVLEDVDAWKQDRIDTRRVVIVTSQGLSLSDQETHRARFLFFQMPGWQLQEYQKACENDHFLKSVETALDAHDPKDLTRGELKDDAKKQLQHKLQAKFELAGHSARWMFGFRAEAVQKAIDGAIGRSRNLIVTAARNVGQQSPDAVNHLFTFLGDRHTPQSQTIVSAHAARLLTLRCDDTTLETVMAMAERDGSLQGKLHELKFARHLRKEKTISVTVRQAGSQRKPVTLQIKQVIEFYYVSDITQLPQNGHIFFPTNTSQCAFDFVLCEHMKEFVGSMAMDTSDNGSAASSASESKVPKKSGKGKSADGTTSASSKTADSTSNTHRAKKGKSTKVEKKIVAPTQTVELNFLQFTIAKTHKIKWRYVNELVQHLRRLGCDVAKTTLTVVTKRDKVYDWNAHRDIVGKPDSKLWDKTVSIWEFD